MQFCKTYYSDSYIIQSLDLLFIPVMNYASENYSVLHYHDIPEMVVVRPTITLNNIYYCWLVITDLNIIDFDNVTPGQRIIISPNLF